MGCSSFFIGMKFASFYLRQARPGELAGFKR